MARIKRRRRIVVAAAGGLAIGAFAFGAALGGGTGPRPAPSVVAKLPLPQLVGQRIVVGFSGADAPPAVKRMIRAGELAGVILFAENLPSRAAGRRLIHQLEALRRPPALRDPLLVMIDQEGGLVKRVNGAPMFSAHEMGLRGSELSRRQGRATAANLRELGVNVDLAPVLDVARPGGTIAEADRAFCSTAARVSATAVSFAAGLQQGGVAAAAKHFPGLGAASENTDVAVQRIDLSKGELRRVDARPYRRFVAMGGELVMLSTAIYPAFSPLPAAFSRQIATGELRRRLGFAGVSITDALESVAVRDFGGPAEAGVAAVRAGTDLLLFTDYEAGAQAARALRRRLRSGALRRSAFEGSVARVLQLRGA